MLFFFFILVIFSSPPFFFLFSIALLRENWVYDREDKRETSHNQGLCSQFLRYEALIDSILEFIYLTMFPQA
jgi:hypothetical protein